MNECINEDSAETFCDTDRCCTCRNGGTSAPSSGGEVAHCKGHKGENRSIAFGKLTDRYIEQSLIALKGAAYREQ